MMPKGSRAFELPFLHSEMEETSMTSCVRRDGGIRDCAGEGVNLC